MFSRVGRTFSALVGQKLLTGVGRTFLSVRQPRKNLCPHQGSSEPGASATGLAAPLAALLLLAAFCGTSARAGELTFPQPDVNVGEVYAGAALARAFPFANGSPEPVEVTDIRASCGCLTPRLDKRLYQPGEKGSIRLEVNTLTQPAGLQSWRLDVIYRRGKIEQTRSLWLRAHILREIMVEPAALALTADRAIAHTITITDHRPRPLRVTAVRSSAPALHVTVGESTRTTTQVKLAVGDDFPPGRHEETVSIYTDDARYSELRVPVTINRRPREPVVARPAAVELAAAPAEPVPSRIVLLQSRDDAPVIVDRITSDNPAVSARWAPGPGNMSTVRVLVDGTRVHGSALKTLLHVYFHQPAQGEIAIAVSCSVD